MIRIHPEWTNALSGYPDTVIAATGANLGVEINGNQICAHDDRAESTVKDWITVPLYPLAEWLTLNWFSIFFETQTFSHTAYKQRHYMTSIGNGFAWPNLYFHSEGEVIALSWRPYNNNSAQISFINEGNERLSKNELETCLHDFLEEVDHHLKSQGIFDTPFQKDWATIQQLDQDEISFCKAAAGLGLDPFDLDAHEAKKITGAAKHLPVSLHETFFQIASGLNISKVSLAIKNSLQEMAQRSNELPELPNLKNDLSIERERIHRKGGLPWEAGYRFARKTREILRMENPPSFDLSGLLSFFGGTSSSKNISRLDLNGASSTYNGLFCMNKSLEPIFAISKHIGKSDGESSDRFHFGRVLFEYLAYSEEVPRLVSQSYTISQQMNRAFAAEFLAPASLIKKALKKRKRLYESEIENIASEFKVSSYVIRHQVRNHGLADLVEIDQS